jgi:hypothetical protein
MPAKGLFWPSMILSKLAIMILHRAFDKNVNIFLQFVTLREFVIRDMCIKK